MEELRIRPIRDGTVIDHIERGMALEVLGILGVDSSTRDVVSVAMNVPSGRMGRKDVVKVEKPEGDDTRRAVPLLGNLLRTTWHRVRAFLVDAGTIISGEDTIETLGEKLLDLIIRIASGEERAWRDTLVTFHDGTVGNLFTVGFTPAFDRSYQLEVRRADLEGEVLSVAPAPVARGHGVVHAPRRDRTAPAPRRGGPRRRSALPLARPRGTRRHGGRQPRVPRRGRAGGGEGRAAGRGDLRRRGAARPRSFKRLTQSDAC